MTSGFVRTVRWVLVLCVLGGFAALLSHRDGGPSGGRPFARTPPTPPGPPGPPSARDRDTRPGPATSSDPDALASEATVPPAAVLGAPLVVHLLERNADDFQDDLGLEAGGDVPAAVTLDGGTAWIHPDVARTTDAKTLARFGVRLADATVPLARCAAILLHEVRFVGRGREGAHVEVHGLPALPGSVALDVPAVGEVLRFDPATERAPFAAYAQRVRLVPEGSRLALSARDADGLSVTFSGRRHDVAAGDRVLLSSLTRRITVTEAALGIEAIDLGPVRRESVPDELLPEVRHGAVEFRTDLTLHLLGRLRSVASEGPEDGDLR